MYCSPQGAAGDGSRRCMQPPQRREPILRATVAAQRGADMPNHKWPLIGLAGLSVIAAIAFFSAAAVVRAPENHGASLHAQPAEETPFYAENATAMDNMMPGMAARPTRRPNANAPAK